MEKNSEFHTVESSLLSFDVIVLVRDVLKHWLLVLTVALMVGVGAYVMTDLSYEPTYTASTTFVVTSRKQSGDGVLGADEQLPDAQNGSG